MKGIILSGGAGSRLYPLTCSCSKQLLPVFDKPMIYYPLSVFMDAGIREILLISTPEDLPRFESLLGDGSCLGLSIQYQVQEKPNGIAEAFILGEWFIKDSPVSLILGDNLFFGHNLAETIRHEIDILDGGTVFGYEVQDPNRYGVIEFNSQMQVIDIIEKPKIAPSNYAVTGLYLYDETVCEKAKSLKPSLRGELEITDLNRLYLSEKRLSTRLFDRGFAWLDTGTPKALQQASQFVHVMQERQGIKVGCIEEIALEKGWITPERLKLLALKMKGCEYSQYLLKQVERFENPSVAFSS